MSTIGVVAESQATETRVAGTPATVAQLIKLGYDVVVESGAGAKSSFPDDAYTEAGATIAPGDQVWASDIVLKVNARHPGAHRGSRRLWKSAATVR